MATVIAIIHGEPGTYGVSFPDFPGAVSGGKTLDEALSRARENLAVHVEAITEEGLDMPALRGLEALKADPEFAEDFGSAVMVGFVSVDLPGRAKRISVTIDERLLERIDQRAEASGETRSGFLAHAARKRLAEQA